MIKKTTVFKIFTYILIFINLVSCQTTKQGQENQTSEKFSNFENLQPTKEQISPATQIDNLIEESASVSDKNSNYDATINLLFAGDIMAHTENYNISNYDKIWSDVKNIVSSADLAFANIESPVDTTKPASSYPNFNMHKDYLQAVIEAGFDVFSLSNNHTNDQGLDGIQETIKTTNILTKEYSEKNQKIYFSGTKLSSEDDFSYNIIEKNGWKILFLPITELLNRPSFSSYINYVPPTENSRNQFISYCKNLREQTKCDLFVLSLHTCEPEYTRKVTVNQKNYYKKLLDSGIDILWANHAHIIKDREFVYNSTAGTQKLIMYANGNTISGQRRSPNFDSAYPDLERDNTGDGLFYYITLKKDFENPNTPPKIVKAEKKFITTYINTANEFVIKQLNEEFIDYLNDVPRTKWAEYIKKRIDIDNNTKDYITWQ